MLKRMGYWEVTQPVWLHRPNHALLIHTVAFCDGMTERWTRKQLQLSFTYEAFGTFLPLNGTGMGWVNGWTDRWTDRWMDRWMNGCLIGWGIVWTAIPKKFYSHCLNVQVETSDEWCPSRVYTGNYAVNIFLDDIVGLSTLSGSLQTTQTGFDGTKGCHLEGPWQIGQGKSLEVQQGQVQSPAPGSG